MAGPAPVSAYMALPRAEPAARIAYGPAPSQVVELFRPEGEGPHPVVLLFHGGCYLQEYEGLPQTSAIAADLAQRGLAVWNVEYRKLGEDGGGYPGTFRDVAQACDRLRDKAERYGLDLSRLVAVGHSAGGHLALWAASRRRLPAESPLWAADPLRIPSVISLGGIGDLEAHGDVFGRACGPDVIARVIGAAERPQPFADTSPAALLPAGLKVTMVHGAFDHVMPPFTGLAYAEVVRQAGDEARVIDIAGAGHFDVVIPGSPAWIVVAETILAETKR